MNDAQDWDKLSDRDRSLRLLGILAEMARSDDDLDPQERQFLHEFARDRGLEPHEVDVVLSRDHVPVKGRPAIAESDRVAVLYCLVSMMQSDQVIAHKEINILRRQGLRLGIRSELVDDFIDLALTYKQSQIPAEELVERLRVYMN